MADISRQGLSRTGEIEMSGKVGDLFLANFANSGASAKQVAFTNEAMTVIGAQTERMVMRGIIGRGKYGTVEEVEFVDFPGESYALKTIVQVRSCAVCNRLM